MVNKVYKFNQEIELFHIGVDFDTRKEIINWTVNTGQIPIQYSEFNQYIYNIFLSYNGPPTLCGLVVLGDYFWLTKKRWTLLFMISRKLCETNHKIRVD